MRKSRVRALKAPLFRRAMVKGEWVRLPPTKRQVRVAKRAYMAMRSGKPFGTNRDEAGA